ncbi:glycerophosphoryl diester phosphodiesterase [Tepidamorphus gemmatus]|uniref:Glycerophosphoryl diester phosphodiesterase n=1 Tax=Tepidamorphus gemmatus TaxID=747076 RepID=A0A4R3MHN9_9HYPH|nr:glycerophosphodiester phosphodiesterase family protein [Tepidamorphus gemmatus]TCT12728.1 glycerophosphoryl diester phosphodiesterase [Tepidamorphus gemmatus]
MAGLSWLTDRPVAHRGLHDARAGIIENTLSAAQAAIAAGYAIEIDLQAAADGTPVVFHDDTLDRLTTATGPVAALGAAELAAIPLKATSDRIPTFRQLLDLVAGQTPLVVEVKSDWSGVPALCERIVADLETYHGPVAIMSFDPKVVDVLRRIAPALPRGIVSESYRDWQEGGTTPWSRFVMRHLLHVWRTKPHFIAYCVDDLPAVSALLLRWLFGLKLLTWTVRTPEQRARAERWADQIIFEGFRP